MISLSKTGGFVAGICHPEKRMDLLREAGFTWTRRDVPFPYEPGRWGVLSPSYQQFKKDLEGYAATGLKTMCISPYPKAFERFGVDPATAEGLAKVRETCRFLAEDLKPYGTAWQVSNELYVYHFRVPLIEAQVAPFLIAGLEGIHQGDPDAALGHNSVVVGTDFGQQLLQELRPYEPLMDYMGLDTYKGTWRDGEIEDILQDIDDMYEACKLPVIVQEFGFASAGEIFTREEALSYINSMGYDSVEAVYADPKPFLMRIPYYISTRVQESREDEWATNALHQMPHLLKKWPGGSRRYRHTPEGQAIFYQELLGKMIDNPHTAGAVIYCWSDDALCFNCYTADCPCETAWSITDHDENPKPAYYVIKDILTKL